MFSVKCIQIVDLTFSSSDRHSSVGTDVGLLLYRTVSIWRFIMSITYNISFQRAKFLLSNFLISQPVLDVEGIVLVKVFVGLVLLLVLMSLRFQRFALVPVDDDGICA